MTDKYAVIGNPVAHSKSPLIHQMFAEQTGQNISYEAILTPLDGFAVKVMELREKGYKGCNVTVPFKFDAYKMSTRLSAHADIAQAVNTLKFNFDGDTVLGENTDGSGLVRDILYNLQVTLKNKRVLLVGAGGAAYGVALPLVHAGAKLTVVNRTVEKAQALASSLDLGKSAISAYRFDEIAGQQFNIVINATSAGLVDSELPLPPGVFASGSLAYDMMYGRVTPFMKFARASGTAVVSDGLGMLVEQAAASFFLWRGVHPMTAPVIAALRQQQ